MNHTRTKPSRTGIAHTDREQQLLDDLRAEIACLTEATEKQNELLAQLLAEERRDSR